MKLNKYDFTDFKVKQLLDIILSHEEIAGMLKRTLTFSNNMVAFYQKMYDNVTWLNENAVLAGSRYFNIETETSDYDFLIDASESTIRKLEEMGFKRIIDNVHTNWKADYADKLTAYVYSIQFYDFINNRTYEIQVQCSTNVEIKQKIYFVLKQMDIFRHTTKPERIKYFVKFCFDVQRNPSLLEELVTIYLNKKEKLTN